MPLIFTYTVTIDDSNKRTYLRSLLERFGWSHHQDTVFRYGKSGKVAADDWLNMIIPSLMCFRSYCQTNNIIVKYASIDAVSHSYIRKSKNRIADAKSIPLIHPTNKQSSKKDIINWLNKCDKFP